MRTIASLLLLCLLCCSLLTACSPTPTARTETWYDCFDTFSSLTVYTDTQEQFDAYAAICRRELWDYHRLLDIYHTYDGLHNLKTVNDCAGSAVTVDARLGAFLAFGKEICRLTEGKTNLALGRVTALWQEARTAGTPYLPRREQITEALSHTDLTCLTVSEDGTVVGLSDAAVRLDAGAIGKGYAAQKIAEALLAADCTSFLLNLGGNVLAYGAKPDGSPWLVGITAPDSSALANATVPLHNAALVTSGSYQRYMTVDGVRYHHIIDPDSGYPDSTYFSVSVQCADSALADALSTALFCMRVEEGKALLAAIPSAAACWILTDGSTEQTENWHWNTEETA